jgi:hypothetical protein
MDQESSFFLHSSALSSQRVGRARCGRWRQAVPGIFRKQGGDSMGITGEVNSHEMRLRVHEMRQPWRPSCASSSRCFWRGRDERSSLLEGQANELSRETLLQNMPRHPPPPTSRASFARLGPRRYAEGGEQTVWCDSPPPASEASGAEGLGVGGLSAGTAASVIATQTRARTPLSEIRSANFDRKRSEVRGLTRDDCAGRDRAGP